MVDYQYYKIDLYGKYFANLPNTVGVLAKIWFTMENYGPLEEKKLRY